MAGPVAVRVFPGQAVQAAEARRWVRALACAADPLATDDAELVLTELFANAIQHTRSGSEGGTVTVAVTADRVIHVHDLGTTGQSACAGLTAAAPVGPGLVPRAGQCSPWPWRRLSPVLARRAAPVEGSPALRTPGTCPRSLRPPTRDAT